MKLAKAEQQRRAVSLQDEESELGKNEDVFDQIQVTSEGNWHKGACVVCMNITCNPILHTCKGHVRCTCIHVGFVHNSSCVFLSSTRCC